MSQRELVLTAFLNGETLTAGEMKSRYGVANARALMTTLRQSGYPIYLNDGDKDSRGRSRVSRYRLGSPSKSVVAAGYKAIAAGLV